MSTSFSGPGHEWEHIVELAREIDHGVASRQGLDNAGVLRLAHAILSFQRRISRRGAAPPGLAGGEGDGGPGEGSQGAVDS